MTDAYARTWERYWSDLPDRPHEAIWDCDPAEAAERHLPLFEPHIDPTLPIVDLGCGSGTQTAYLAGRFGGALGVDFSAAALAIARESAPAGVTLRSLDLRDAAAARSLHAEIGDANLYVRGLFHQMRPEDRPRLAATIAVLLGGQGGRGRAFDVEMAPASAAQMQELGGRSAKLRRVFEHGLTPADWTDGALLRCVESAGLRVADRGPAVLYATEQVADTRVELDMLYVVLAPPPGP